MEASAPVSSESLRRPPGGRGEHDLGVPRAGQLDRGTDGERLAAAGAAGEDGDLPAEREPDGGLLLGGERGPRTPREPAERLVPVDVLEAGHPVLRGAQQTMHLGGQGDLGAVEGDQVHGGDRLTVLGARHLLPYDALRVLRELGQAVDDEPGVDLEQLHPVGDQPLLGQEAVPLVGGLRKGVLEPGLDPLGAVVRDADGLRDAVGGEESDAPDVGSQPVGLVLHDGDRGVLVLLVDADGDGGGDADALEEDHDLLDRLLFLPGRGDHLRPLRAESGHLHEALRVLLDDVQGVDAEVGGDAVGHDRPDALDQARSEVAADALDGRREDRRVVVDLELLAELRVRGPTPLHPQGLAGLGTEERADDGEQVPAPRPVSTRATV